MSRAEALAVFDETVARVQSRVSALRGLTPTLPIQSNLENTDKLHDLADAHFKRRNLREQVFQTEEVYKSRSSSLQALDGSPESLVALTSTTP